MVRFLKPALVSGYFGWLVSLAWAQSNISVDGSCGIASNTTCLDSPYGSCCSIRGFCGASSDFCNPTAGCQSTYGSCSTNASFISYDGKCGSTDPNSQVCVGSSYGSCCSQKGWCGSTADYCGTGCQSKFGTCGGANTTIDIGSNDASSASISTTSPTASTSQSLPTTSPFVGVNTSANSNETQNEIGQPSLLSLEIAIGILSALLLLSILAVCVWRYKLSAKKESLPSEEQACEEKKRCACGRLSIYEIPPHRNRMSDFLSNMVSQRPQPVELCSAGHGRAELRGGPNEF